MPHNLMEHRSSMGNLEHPTSWFAVLWTLWSLSAEKGVAIQRSRIRGWRVRSVPDTDISHHPVEETLEAVPVLRKPPDDLRCRERMLG